jgi:rod shape-determining protein MreC
MSPTVATSQRIRYWVGPVVAGLFSLTLLFLPLESRRRTAAVLEWTVFFPFRYAVGWGPRSLAMKEELARLTGQLARDRVGEDRMLEISEENQRLRRLLGFQRRGGEELHPAVVVGRQRGRTGDLLVVQPSGKFRPGPGTPVVVPDGLLGWVADSRGGLVRLECLTNRRASVSVLDQRSREEGILRWSRQRRDQLVILSVPIQSDWKPGDRVITSGLGTIFPRGLLVGWVAGSQPEEVGPLKRIYVRPAASPAQSEEVFFLVADQPGTAENRESTLYPVDPGVALSGLRLGGNDTLSPGVGPVP